MTRIIPKKKLPLLLRQIEQFYNKTTTKPKKYPYPYSENSRNKTVVISIPKDAENDAQILAKQGRRPEAMQQIMKLTGVSLSIAKDYIESLL